MIEEELRSLGFTDNEVKVYLTLLRIGSAKAGRIAKECSIERTSTYDALKRLQQKGVVSAVIEANRKLFSAADPAKIVEIFTEKQERAALILPKLEQLRHFEREKESMLKFRGYAGIKTVLNDVLKTCPEGGEYVILGSEGQLSERMSVFTKIFVARKDRKKIRSRILLRKGRKWQPFGKSRYVKARYMPQGVLSPTVTTVYENKVALILWSEIPEAVIIDDLATAQTFRSYFEFMWKHAKVK